MNRTFITKAALVCMLGASANMGWAQAGSDPSSNPNSQTSPGAAAGTVVDQTGRGKGAMSDMSDDGAMRKQHKRSARHHRRASHHRAATSAKDTDSGSTPSNMGGGADMRGRTGMSSSSTDPGNMNRDGSGMGSRPNTSGMGDGSNTTGRNSGMNIPGGTPGMSNGNGTGTTGTGTGTGTGMGSPTGSDMGRPAGTGMAPTTPPGMNSPANGAR